MAAMPIYGKRLKIFFRTKKASRLNLGIKHRGLSAYQVCSNFDPSMTFDLSMARSNLHLYILVVGKMLKNHFLKMY